MHDQYTVMLGNLIEVLNVILYTSVSHAMSRLEVRERYEQLRRCG